MAAVQLPWSQSRPHAKPPSVLCAAPLPGAWPERCLRQLQMAGLQPGSVTAMLGLSGVQVGSVLGRQGCNIQQIRQVGPGSRLQDCMALCNMSSCCFLHCWLREAGTARWQIL